MSSIVQKANQNTNNLDLSKVKRRVLLSLFILGVSMFSMAQFTVSIGTSFRTEDMKNRNYFLKDISHNNGNRFVHNYTLIGGSYRIKNFKTQAEIGFFKHNNVLILSQHRYQDLDPHGGGYAKNTNYFGNVDFSYLGLVLSESFEKDIPGFLFKKLKTSYGLGVFGQVDFLVYQREFGQVVNTFESLDGIMYSSETHNEQFNVLSFDTVSYQAGIHMNRGIYWKDFHFDLSVSIGRLMKPRSINIQSYEIYDPDRSAGHMYFFQTTFRISYIFKGRIKKSDIE